MTMIGTVEENNQPVKSRPKYLEPNKPIIIITAVVLMVFLFGVVGLMMAVSVVAVVVGVKKVMEQRS